MGTWGIGSQWCNRLPPMGEVGRFSFWIKGKEVRRYEEASYVVGRGAHDGADDVVWWSCIRQNRTGELREPRRQPPGRAAARVYGWWPDAESGHEPRGQCPAGAATVRTVAQRKGAGTFSGPGPSSSCPYSPMSWKGCSQNSCIFQVAWAHYICKPGGSFTFLFLPPSAGAPFFRAGLFPFPSPAHLVALIHQRPRRGVLRSSPK